MCGIAVLTFSNLHPDASRLLRQLSDGLAHRGPDDLGFLQWTGDGPPVVSRQPRDEPPSRMAMVHRRLAILDLSDAGWQPMSTPDGRFHLVFNGEIYNYLELRAELSQGGYQFRSQSDTEVLLAALARWGPDALRRLVGMFALALLDCQARTLLFARDCFGIKPLYYTSWDGGLAWASEIKVLLSLPGVPRRVNPQRAYEYLRFGLADYGDETMIEGIGQLPPACYVELSLDGNHQGPVRRYWQPDLDRRAEISFDEAAARMQSLFLKSVEMHLRSDVPVGAALSGGIDSSAIVASMRQIVGPALDLHTFSYVAEGSDVNEERYAQLVGGQSATRIHKVRATPQQLCEELDQLIDSQDEPFGSTSIFAQRCVFRAAAGQGVKVMLDGQGADEMLGGYRYFLAARLASLLRGGRLAAARQLAAGAARLPGGAGMPTVRHGLGLLLPGFMQRLARQAVGQPLIPAWLDRQWLASRGVVAAGPRQPRGPRFLQQQLWTTIAETSLPSLLRYEDRNSMHVSIESRVPFLTPALVEFVLSLPEDYIVGTDGVSKRLFRAAMRGIVPDEILDRKDKIGFATPEAEWLVQLRPWVDGVLASDAAAGIAAIRVGAMQRQWNEFVETGRGFDFRFWRWVNFIRWVQQRDIMVS